MDNAQPTNQSFSSIETQRELRIEKMNTLSHLDLILTLLLVTEILALILFHFGSILSTNMISQAVFTKCSKLLTPY
jgi:hypothetical protein